MDDGSAQCSEEGLNSLQCSLSTFSGVNTAYTKQFAVFSGFDTAYIEQNREYPGGRYCFY